MTGRGVGYAAAFGGGVVSFQSPCVLPLVPTYPSIITRPLDDLGGAAAPHSDDTRPSPPKHDGLPGTSHTATGTRRRVLDFPGGPATSAMTRSLSHDGRDAGAGRAAAARRAPRCRSRPARRSSRTPAAASGTPHHILAHRAVHRDGCFCGGPGLAGTDGRAQTLQIRPPRRNALAASITKIGGGALLVAELGTPSRLQA